MKINKQTILTVTVFLLVVSIVSSCSSKSSMDNSITRNNMPITEESERPEGSPGEAQDIGLGISGIEPEKVITTVHLSLETTEFDSTIESLGKIIGANKGYIENSHISDRGHINNKIFKYADYVIRVPKNSVEGFTNEIDSIGNIISQNVSKEDITKQYYDTESRLNLLKTKEERMTALLKQADKMEDIITIENQLSDIIHQKESLTKNILDMDDKVSYSIIHMNISEVERLRSDATAKTTFATRISNAFSNSLYSFKVFVEGFVIVIIYIWPYLLIGGLIAFLVLKFIGFRRRRRSS